jgi:phosphatidylglycerophosphatase A
MDRLRESAATFFYLGEFPFASGTAGSLGAVALYLVASLWLAGTALSLLAAAAGVVFAIVGIGIGRWAQEYYKERDPREFVLDEAAGMMIALIAVTPLVQSKEPWKLALAAFLFFRAFDVIKPFPARRSERLRGGWGIVLDDVFAAIYAAICTHLWFHYV